jgi:type II secretory pathway pseudopilin PulG
MPAARPQANDQGETLIELIIAIAIMGIAMVAIVGSMVTSILMSDVHRKEATAAAYVRDYAEKLESYVASGTSATPHYVACAAGSDYAPGIVGLTGMPTAYTASATAAKSWSGSTWVTCATDNGYQKVTLAVRSSDGRAVEKLDVILRTPCRSTDALCA